MPRIAVSSDIKAPVEEVFKMFTDVESAPGRVQGVKKVELLTTGRFDQGTRWLETREVLGRTDDAEMEVTSYVHNSTYTITHHKGGVRIDTVFKFEPAPDGTDGTRVSVEFELNPQGLPPGLLSPLEWAIGGKVRHVLSDDLEDLRRSIEQVAKV